MRDRLLAMARRRGFIWPAFDIYGGLSGFYDYGPLGSELKRNIINLWREYYVLREGFAEIDSPNLSPEEVFRASGHLDKFEDLMTVCTSCNASFRADRLVKAENADSMSADELWEEMKREGVKCPECGGELLKPEPFNLMFGTTVGAGGKREQRAYLRPETAQAMFMDFKYLYRYFREKLPFGAVQIGKGFRNEISPRQGLLRLREFAMAEAEVFFDPKDKEWRGFERIDDEYLTLLPNTGGEYTLPISEALEKGIIKSRALAYFLGITKKFLVDAGIGEKKLRFREHLQDEMAHYAKDCWDAEVLLSYGWVELVGIADRTDYDLSRHMEYSGENLKALRRYSEPEEREISEIIPDYSKLGPLFGKDAKKIAEKLVSMGPELKGDIVLNIDGQEYTVPESAYTVKKVKKLLSGEEFTPHVIEPSYGIDRILYAVLEHNYKEIVNGSETYRVLSLPPRIAPVKTGVFPLMPKDGMDEKAMEIYDMLRRAGINAFYDSSGSIGRRYARMDEIGTPYCITVDYQSLEDDTVTIRNRDTKQQERIKINDIVKMLHSIERGTA